MGGNVHSAFRPREQDMDYETVMVGLALDRPNDAWLAVAGPVPPRQSIMTRPRRA